MVTQNRPSADSYSSHSLRRGGAQFLRDAGVPRDLIKLMGRWKSDAVDVYMRSASKEMHARLARQFGAHKKRVTYPFKKIEYLEERLAK